MATKAIDVVFRNLMLFYSANDGLHVFIPSNKHRAHLRDILTGTEVPLSQSRVSLRVDDKAVTGGTPLVDPDSRVVTMEWLTGDEEIEVPGDLIKSGTVHESLCAHVTVGGGTLTAYPMSEFPELADQKARFEVEKGRFEEHLITDTFVYHLDITASTRAELVVTGPRRKQVVFDITDGARFEIVNIDDKLGGVTAESDHRKEEVNAILGLLERGSVACEVHACTGFYVGNPNAGSGQPAD